MCSFVCGKRHKDLESEHLMGFVNHTVSCGLAGNLEMFRSLGREQVGKQSAHWVAELWCVFLR